MIIKFIEILASGAIWARPWKTVSLCIWGWPRPHSHNGWSQGMYSHFWLYPGWAQPLWECACVTQIKWRDHAQWRNLGFLTRHRQDCFDEVFLWRRVTCIGHGSLNSRIFVCLIPHPLLTNDFGCQTSHNLIYRKSHYDRVIDDWYDAMNECEYIMSCFLDVQMFWLHQSWSVTKKVIFICYKWYRTYVFS